MSLSFTIVTYDISDDQRRTRVYQYLRGWGDHLQYSVFRVLASDVELMRLKIGLDNLVHHEADQILIFNLGPADGRGKDAVEAIGRTYTPPERRAIII